MSTDKTPFKQWAIVEIMGHQKYAGLVTEEIIAGHAFVRVDVPETSPESPAFSKLFGPQSIYCITPVTEAIAVSAAKSYRQTPVSIFEMSQAMRDELSRLQRPSLPAHPSSDDDPPDDELDPAREMFAL